VTETQGTGCPATQGFWHKASHWPTVSGTADGVTWDKSAKTLTIGGTTYTQAQILELLPSGSLHSGGVENDLRREQVDSGQVGGNRSNDRVNGRGMPCAGNDVEGGGYELA